MLWTMNPTSSRWLSSWMRGTSLFPRFSQMMLPSRSHSIRPTPVSASRTSCRTPDSAPGGPSASVNRRRISWSADSLIGGNSGTADAIFKALRSPATDNWANWSSYRAARDPETGEDAMARDEARRTGNGNGNGDGYSTVRNQSRKKGYGPERPAVRVRDLIVSPGVLGRRTLVLRRAASGDGPGGVRGAAGEGHRIAVEGTGEAERGPPPLPRRQPIFGRRRLSLPPGQ